VDDLSAVRAAIALALASTVACSTLTESVRALMASEVSPMAVEHDAAEDVVRDGVSGGEEMAVDGEGVAGGE
jgi:hypothetical protein